MNIEIENEIQKVYSTIMSKPIQLLNIFNNFFGEPRVDMQGFPNIKEFKEMFDNIQIKHLVSRTSSMYNDDFINDFIHNYGDLFLTDIPENKYIIVFSLLNINFIKEYFDKSRGFILVYFPYVKITNEYGYSVDIRNLYAKIKVSIYGTMIGYFGLNRSEYPLLHMRENYMHSHIAYIPFNNFTSFQTPCLGTGPIRETISSLNREFNSDLWELFCLELSKYVEVESIEGTPYHRLEELGKSCRATEANTGIVVNSLSTDYIDMFRSFVPYFIKQGKLKFNYKNNSYSLGMSISEYILTISNEFINWYNAQFNKERKFSYTLQQLLDNWVLHRCIIANNTLYFNYNNSSRNSYIKYIGEKVCTFKGQDILINITDSEELNTTNESLILNPSYCFWILTKILQVLNFRYGRNTKQTDSTNDRVSEKVRYF